MKQYIYSVDFVIPADDMKESFWKVYSKFKEKFKNDLKILYHLNNISEMSEK